MYGKIFKYTEQEAKDEAIELLTDLDLLSKKDEYAQTLSGKFKNNIKINLKI